MSFSDLQQCIQYSSFSKDFIINLEKNLLNFVKRNSNPLTSPNFNTPGKDDLGILIPLLSKYSDDETIIYLILSTLKILSRKSENRKNIQFSVIDAICTVLNSPKNNRIACEASNVILNICYEKENVKTAIECGCIPPLIAFLTSSDSFLQSAAAGAIQSICFQKIGKVIVREAGGIQNITSLLSNSNDTVVKCRAIGAIHNLSSDFESIAIIREQNAIPALILLLKDPCAQIAEAAAGCIQNLSREELSRTIIQKYGGIPPLMDLLFANHLHAQVCAAGALLNILGPDLGKENKDNLDRKALKKILSLSVCIGQMYDILFSE